MSRLFFFSCVSVWWDLRENGHWRRPRRRPIRGRNPRRKRPDAVAKLLWLNCFQHCNPRPGFSAVRELWEGKKTNKIFKFNYLIERRHQLKGAADRTACNIISKTHFCWRLNAPGCDCLRSIRICFCVRDLTRMSSNSIAALLTAGAKKNQVWTILISQTKESILK